MSATRKSPRLREPRGDLVSAIRSEWTKFRTVRGWLIGLVVAAGLCIVFAFLVPSSTHEGGCTGPPPPGAGPNSPGTNCYTGHPFVPAGPDGPDGEAVADSYQFVAHKLTGNGTLTAQVSSLTGVTSTQSTNVAPSASTVTRSRLAAWAKAGILLTPSTRQGSAYAAVMATGSHGIRWQYNYTHDSPGQRGVLTTASPRWLRLTRTGDTLTGYDSSNGSSWTQIGTAHLAGLPATVYVGLFVTSPVSFRGSSGAPTRATATFDQVTLQGQTSTNSWQSRSVGTGPRDFYPTLGAGSYRHFDNTFVLSGSGDIAPAVGLIEGDTASSGLLTGLIAALIVLIVIATMFITAEYRHGLIRTTFTATPSRGRVLAAKAVVIGAVTGVAAAAIGVPLAEHILRANGSYVFPAGTLTIARIIAGSGVLVAVTAVAVLALGAILRRSAAAVTAGIAVFVLPYIIGSIISGSAETWLFRLTPAAGFSILGAFPRSPLVSYPYTVVNGYYPLSAWAGLAVLCAYSALALGTATWLLRRRDA